MQRQSFKSDTSFLEKISMGAIGTHRVFERLKDQGHKPIELERGSMSFKIWRNIKIKRIRVPDILCVSCGHRVESRSKTSFEISMSHSFSDPDRGWDNGLNDSDFVALVVCRKVGVRPIDWQADDLVQFVSVGDLRSAYARGLALSMRPKGAGEGFEARVYWPAVIAKSAGKVEFVAEDRIQYRRESDGRLITLSLKKRGISLECFINRDDKVTENQVLAAVVPVVRQFPCSQQTDCQYYVRQLASASLTERYTAAKALSMFQVEDIYKALVNKVEDRDEHLYVRLEAAVSLARCGEERGWSFIRGCLSDNYLQNRLEAVITLGEILSEKSCETLCSVLTDSRQHPEIRAGAAWALGELRNKQALDVLIDSFSAEDEDVRSEAARALVKLASQYTEDIVSKFFPASPDIRPGMAWVLSKSETLSFESLLNLLTNADEDARHWVSYILGFQDRYKYISQIEKLKEQDPQVYFAVTVLWKILTSWVYNLEEY